MYSRLQGRILCKCAGEQGTTGIDVVKEVSHVLPDETHESHNTALIQALLLAGCLGKPHFRLDNICLVSSTCFDSL